MEEFKKRLTHLHHCNGIGWKAIFHLLKADPELKNLYRCPPLQNVPNLTKNNFLDNINSITIHDYFHEYSLNDIHMITYFDKEYPSLLKETFQPPWVLYAKGNINLLNNGIKLAAVGSRQATSYGKNAIKALFPKLIEKEIILVSGLAAGIDTCVHQTAMRLGGHTIAVIAGGLYHIYPQENRNLALEMMKNQLILSEYPPNTRPSRWHFPARNRIISGMSSGTLIIEAKQKSGSLITANYAVQEGRDVFAIPGNIFSPFSEGTNELIQQGAKLVKSSGDILDELIY
ncbi:DNA-processing protein DprA [Bacillus dakarensis]|uniref:DNA-processing protein DprA n=1 Tax=Robertmurraya dakarensis TaxID=1926278 RepID=UPI000981E5F5|nr:DNA-processing protein DprA [Bacillus dakarensis]